MSLTINESSRPTIPIMPEGTYIGVCNLLVDLGVQYNKTFDSYARKIVIGWEFPEEHITIDGEERNRTITKTFTASLGGKANLRQFLIAWRGRDFTPEELKAFDLKNIVGVPAMINVVHTHRQDKTFANVGGILALPKGMPKPKLSGYATVFDLDVDPIERIDSLPAWIAELIKSSETYLDRISKQVSDDIAETDPPAIEVLPEDTDNDLPF